jgi:hypothetical protein
MKLIPMTSPTGKQFAMVDDADFDWLNQWKWRAVSRSGQPTYAMRQTGRKFIRMHVLVFGDNNPDHIDRNGLNNRRGNLRPATKSQNGANSKLKKNNTSGFKGVYWYKAFQKWTGSIMCNGKRHFTGYFSDAREAARTYDSLSRKLFGKFATTNKSLGLL